MLKNGLHGEAPVKWTAYLPPAWTPINYRLHADLMFLPNSAGQSRFIAQNRDVGHPPGESCSGEDQRGGGGMTRSGRFLVKADR